MGCSLGRGAPPPPAASGPGLVLLLLGYLRGTREHQAGITVEEQSGDPDVAALIESLATRSAFETARLMAMLRHRCWPGGQADRMEPPALEWVRRWARRKGVSVSGLLRKLVALQMEREARSREAREQAESGPSLRSDANGVQ